MVVQYHMDMKTTPQHCVPTAEHSTAARCSLGWMHWHQLEVWALTAFFVTLAREIWTAGSELLHHFLFPSLYQFSTCEAQYPTTKCSCNSCHFEACEEADGTPHHSSDECTCHRQGCQLVLCSL